MNLDDPESYDAEGIRFKVATGTAGIVATCEQGSGAMPVSFMAPDVAAEVLQVLQDAIDRIETLTPGSYVLEFIEYELTEPLGDAIAKLRTKADG